MKNPDGSKSRVIDEEAANAVRRIFDMTLEGLGSHQIADVLAADKIMTPAQYWKSKDIKKYTNPYRQRASVIVNMKMNLLKSLWDIP